ncbi:hypothetical protein GCM10011376_23650 [Nocardioides flavus (ex Wang et al. 2016)]|uniref:DUF3152 domain-containing protein n=1 Tax=Nocardioides flavus (ex Wang et al. 2016) TaxID=2058780 RepID=A0ABQ3HLG0_9ACTN|nr:DUF3152 domain-containing protein [Nocardioides flavus (ex Wang et al. 2016)]GHE17755.1 hypothetical protein GCM10011376_23650 [Nocardioides flavus (ex Wang et al. 2016)]
MIRPARALVAVALVLAVIAVPGSPASAFEAEGRQDRWHANGQRAEAYAVPARRRVTYSVTTRGRITASMEVFRRHAQETFDDPRGWRAGGVRFRRVRRGGNFTLVLAAAGTLPSFSSSCSVQWSCRVGRYVVINQLRWTRASPAWNAAGRSRRDYRHLVVNHETGHWLGLGHASCRRGGGRAPVMMQQSKGTGGCRFNPWPLPGEAAAVRRR